MPMIVLYFLSIFSKRAKLALGGIVWDELDAKLPEAVGVIEDDKPRMEKFSKISESLGCIKKQALRTWLEDQVYDLTHNFSEFATSREEEFERKWLQIFNEHLRVLKLKIP